MFGRGILDPVWGSFSWADLLLVVAWLLLLAAIDGILALYSRRARKARHASGAPGTFQSFWGAGAKPLHAIVWVLGVHIIAGPVIREIAAGTESGALIAESFRRFLRLVLLACLIWLAYRLIKPLEETLLRWTRKSAGTWDDFFVSLLATCARVVVPVLALIVALPTFGLPSSYDQLLGKVSSLLIIGAISWVLFRSVTVLEKFVTSKYDVSAADNLQARKVHTQIRVLTKTLHVLIGIFAVASALMVFEQVRRLGGSILASAGVIGIIVGFAAQKTIANLFAGFQLAMTQPIRIDDVVIVEGEWGRVEEITLTYVVVRIWDERRLVVPLSYFIEKPFQNWTRVSAKLLGAVTLWVDYRTPFAKLREEVRRIVESSPNWDRRFWNLQVTDATDRAVQVRILATAENSSKAFDLRCEIREHLITAVQKHHPDCFPRVRASVHAPEATMVAERVG